MQTHKVSLEEQLKIFTLQEVANNAMQETCLLIVVFKVYRDKQTGILKCLPVEIN